MRIPSSSFRRTHGSQNNFPQRWSSGDVWNRSVQYEKDIRGCRYSIDVMFLEKFERLGKTNKDLKKVDFHLVGFAGGTTYPLGVVYLPVVLAEEQKSINIDIFCILLETPLTDSSIIDWTTMTQNRYLHRPRCRRSFGWASHFQRMLCEIHGRWNHRET